MTNRGADKDVPASRRPKRRLLLDNTRGRKMRTIRDHWRRTRGQPTLSEDQIAAELVDQEHKRVASELAAAAPPPVEIVDALEERSLDGMTASDFATYLRTRREAMHKTQANIADEAHVGERIIWLLEKQGPVRMQRETFEDIMRAYGIPVDEALAMMSDAPRAYFGRDEIVWKQEK